MSQRGGGSDPPAPASFRFLLDADISPRVAQVGRALGLDAISVYECARGELRDDEQLRLAAADGRLLVTRNRDDYLRWTEEFARTGAAHAGVLIVSRSILATRPEPLAYALLGWTERMAARSGGQPLGPYFLDFLSAPTTD